MHIQGDLQMVFDALHEMGIIDPLLKKDWQKVSQEKGIYREDVIMAMQAVNHNQGNYANLKRVLSSFDGKTLELLAMEVAREYADYSSRTTLH